MLFVIYLNNRHGLDLLLNINPTIIDQFIYNVLYVLITYHLNKFTRK